MYLSLKVSQNVHIGSAQQTDQMHFCIVFIYFVYLLKFHLGSFLDSKNKPSLLQISDEPTSKTMTKLYDARAPLTNMD